MAHILILHIFISFQQLTFKLRNFTDYNAFFPAVCWQIFTDWSGKVEGSIELWFTFEFSN